MTVVLNDGTKVTGLPGSAPNYPYEHELFISQLWKTDHQGTPLEPNAESRGMLIFASQIKAIIFLEKPAAA